MDLNAEAEVLGKVPLFAMLDQTKLKLLAFTSDSLTYHDGEILFNAGEPSDSAYVILDGAIEVLIDDKGGLRPAFVRNKYELIGEMGVVNNAPRNASVRAKGEVTVLKITKDAFMKMLRENASMAVEVIRQLSDRLAQTHAQYEALQAKLADS